MSPGRSEDSHSARSLTIPGVVNARDLGGLSGRDGRIRTGVLVRSAEWTFAKATGQKAIGTMNMTHAVDLRSDGERQWRPDPFIQGITRLPVDVMGDGHAVSRLAMVVLESANGSDVDSFHLEPLLNDPEVAFRELGQGRARTKFLSGYRAFADSTKARQGLSLILALLADRQRVAVHCAAGKDRTGWVIATILLYLKVPYEKVLADYLQSRDELAAAVTNVLERAEAKGVDPSLVEPLLTVREEYLETFLRQVDISFGSIDRYVEEGLGLGPLRGARLRSALLEG